MRAAAVPDPRRLDTAEDRVELVVADVEADVMALDRVPIGEVEGQGLVDVDGREAAPRLLPGHAEKAGQEPGRRERVV